MIYFDEERIRKVLDNPKGYFGKYPHSKIIWRMLQAMYRRQTSLEREVQATVVENGVGFGAFDSNFLSSVAQSSLKYKNLTTAQAFVVAKPLKKYMRQLIEIANEHQKQKAPPPGKKKRSPKQLPISDWTYTRD